MNQRSTNRRHLIRNAASLSLALVLTGCDSQPNAGSTPAPQKTLRTNQAASLEQRVQTLVVEQLGLKTPPKATDRLVEDLGADSLDCVELVMALEEEFRIAIADEAAVKLKTLADIVAYLETATPRVQTP
jgi:acyl carrier protein